MNLATFLDIASAITPDSELLVAGEDRRTFETVRMRTAALAGGLVELDAGVIGVLATNHPDALETIYAGARAGIPVVSLSYRVGKEELGQLLEHVGVDTLVLEERYVEVAREAGADPDRMFVIPRDLDELRDRGKPVEDPLEVADEHVAAYLYTSGTTSTPKAVMLTHANFSAYLLDTVEAADGSDRGATLLSVPLYHVAGLVACWSNTYAGRRMVLLPQFDAGAWLEAVERERISHAFVVPTMLHQLLNHPGFASTDLSSLETLSYGAAPCPVPLVRRAIEAFPVTVGFVNAFGQTETTSTVTVLGPEDHRLDGTPEEREIKLRRLGSVGRPVPGVEIDVRDPDGAAVAQGTLGEVWLRTSRTMRGYHQSDVQTEAVLSDDGWLRTGDMGWVDEGGYLFLEGRADDLIIRGGENISPREIEDVLHEHPDVHEAAVIGAPDDQWGQVVEAVVVAGPGFDADSVTAFCRSRLSSQKVPVRLRLVDDLPRTPTGKVVKRLLRT